MTNAFAQAWGSRGDTFGRVDDVQRVTVRPAVDGPATDRPALPTGELADDVRRVRALANWMDARFNVLGVRFGLDGLVGLIPGVGDTLTAAVSLYPLWVARKHGLGTSVKLRMGLNVLADWAVGLVPVAGDLFDVAFKANLRNADLLERVAAAHPR